MTRFLEKHFLRKLLTSILTGFGTERVKQATVVEVTRETLRTPKPEQRVPLVPKTRNDPRCGAGKMARFRGRFGMPIRNFYDLKIQIDTVILFRNALRTMLRRGERDICSRALYI